MGKEKHGGYKRVNGRPRNEAVHLTDAELRAMSAELRSERHTGEKDRAARRLETVRKREENGGV